MKKRIETRPGKCGGKPCIRGTRIPVQTIVACLPEWSVTRICREFPPLTRDDVFAAIRYARRNGLKKLKSPEARCRHGAAWPTLFGEHGFMWCPDCGAVRTIIRTLTKPHGFVFNQRGWLYPHGHDAVLRRLDVIG